MVAWCKLATPPTRHMRSCGAVAIGFECQDVFRGQQGQVGHHGVFDDHHAKQGRQRGEWPLLDVHSRDILARVSFNKVGPSRWLRQAGVLGPRPCQGNIGQRVFMDADQGLREGPVPEPEAAVRVACRKRCEVALRHPRATPHRPGAGSVCRRVRSCLRADGNPSRESFSATSASLGSSPYGGSNVPARGRAALRISCPCFDQSEPCWCVPSRYKE